MIVCTSVFKKKTNSVGGMKRQNAKERKSVRKRIVQSGFSAGQVMVILDSLATQWKGKGEGVNKWLPLFVSLADSGCEHAQTHPRPCFVSVTMTRKTSWYARWVSLSDNSFGSLFCRAEPSPVYGRHPSVTYVLFKRETSAPPYHPP